MTFIRPEASFVGQVLDRVGIKTLLGVLLTLGAWQGRTSQLVAGHDKLLDVHRAELEQKVDRPTYEVDMKEIHDDLREIRQNQNETNRLLMERSH